MFKSWGPARSAVVAVFAFVVALLAPLAGVPASPASAAANSLQIDKTVDVASPSPGQEFTYTIQARCSEEDCLGATIEDELPDELSGFPITNVAYSPNGTPSEVTWQPGGTSEPPATVTSDTAIAVEVQEPTDNPAGTGLNAGETYTIAISLRVPADYPPGDSGPIVNPASVSADNADTKTDEAEITINVPIELDLAVDKSWTPGEQAFNPGAESTIGLDAENTSNTAVDSLTIQEPAAAPDGATELDASNPFTITDFAGFGDTSLPAGCDTVQVDAYVESTGTWSWVEGDSVAAPAVQLPGGVSNADVSGIRVTCAGDLPPGEALSVDLAVEQRSTHRNDDTDLSTEVHTVDNTTTGTATLEGEDPVTDDANASFTVSPSIPTVETNKNIQPGSITAGQEAAATITGTNGDVPVSELQLADLDFFTDEVTFGGFANAPTWPAGATDAVVTYHLLEGDAEDVTFTDGETPAAPSSAISGFEITWTGDLIAADETGSVAFAIDTTEDATAGEPEVTLTNTVDAEATAPNGLSDDASDSDDLRIVDPSITTSLTKTVRPSAPVSPGDTVISSLEANASSQGDGALVDEIVVEDVWGGGEDEFWNAFDLASVAPTQVPADTTLTVEVRDTDGTWHELATHGPQGAATVFQMAQGEMTTALSSLGLTADDVDGIRFGFEADDGFPTNTTVTPNVEFAARGELRTGGDVTPGPDEPTPYLNTATVDADGESAGGNDLHDDAEDTGTGTVVTDDGGPGPGLGVEKSWVEAAVDSQSGQRATTHLDWSVDEGYSPVSLQDMAGDPATTPVAETVYDAFDLVRVDPIGADDEPYSDGWYLRYDTVTEVALHDGTSWNVVSAPGGSWMTGDRGFKGYDLSAAERASTVGVRITVEETAADTAAREDAQQTGAAFDPYAPEPDSGVGSGSVDRTFPLTWEVRDTKRSDDGFVVEDTTYNTDDAGLVDNSVEVTGTPSDGGDPVSDTDADTIQILDPDPGVEVTKAVTPTEDIFTPPVGTDPASYPTATWTITGHNASTAKATFVRLTDPATCTDTSLGDCESEADAAGAVADPFDTGADHLTDPSVATPFDRFDATGITIAAGRDAQVDLAASTVWLLRYDGGDYTTEQTTAAAVNAMAAGDLADVVGISVTFQDTDPSAGGTITQDNDLSITVDSILRPTLRSSGEDQVLRAGDTVDVVNRTFAQSYDPVANPGTSTGDVGDATATLTGGEVNITPTKSVEPSVINEPDADTPVTVTLGADQGSDPRSTLSPQQVVIEDQAESPDFWNTFEFTGLGAVTLPDGADQVQVDVYDGSDWVTGTAGPTATLPGEVATADVQGIRFTFSRADGELFSPAVPAPNWNASAAFSAELRDAERDSGDPVEFDERTIENTQTSWSTRPDGNDAEPKDADDEITLSPGTQEIAVHKLTNDGNRLAAVGDAVPFDLSFENVGTGYLTVEELRDVLPPELVYIGDPEPEFTADPDGLLSEDVTVSTSEDGDTVVFAWPEDGQRMKPGETFDIRLHLELQPGLGTGETATNTMTVETAEELDSCRNIEQDGPLTDDFDEDPHTCGTTDYVAVINGPNLYTTKGVRGSLPGAYVPGAPDATCTPTLTATPGAAVATDGRFYRPQCVANSQVGGTDDWVLRSANAGTVGIDEMTIFDQLPVAGDQLLVSGNPRGSQYRPQLVADSLEITAPEGATQTVEVTTSPDVCVGTWTDLATEPVCEQSGETWVAADGSTDWSSVTGLRVHLDFGDTSGGALEAGEIVDVNYSTTNVLESGDDPGGAARSVPADDQLALNQHGIKFRYSDRDEFRQISPSRVGVHLRFGGIRIEKETTGPANAYAPDEFLVDVSCVAGDEQLRLGDDAVVELNEANDFSARIDGIPLSEPGTSCTVTEQGDTGEFGETSREGSPTTLQVTEPTDPNRPGQAVPAAQTASIGNDYQFTGLSLTKLVDTEAVDTEFGPFTFTMACTSITGDPVTFDDEATTELSFELEAGGTFEAPTDRIPVGAECTVTETDDFFADEIVYVGDNVADNGDGSAIVTPGVEAAEVEVTNAYDAGTVTVEKVVDGAGADRYGTGTFAFEATCTYQEQTPYDGGFDLRAGDSMTLGPFPVGTSCSVEETVAGGATTTALDPDEGVVVVPAPDAEDALSAVSLTATNTFDLTSLDVTKEVVGDTDAAGAEGPFTVALACTWAVGGEQVALDVPGGADRTLTRKNGYQASYRELPSSADCTLTETETGGAASTAVSSEVAGDLTEASDVAIDVDLSTTTGPDQAAAHLVNTFVADGDGDGEGDARGDGGLPGAGGDVAAWQVALGALLLAAGGAAVVAARRRRAGSDG